jgi:hypothetical protein
MQLLLYNDLAVNGNLSQICPQMTQMFADGFFIYSCLHPIFICVYLWTKKHSRHLTTPQQGGQ